VSVLHPLLLAHLRTQAPEVHWALEIDMADGTTVRLGFGADSRSLGHIKPWLRDMGTLQRRLSEWRGGIEAPTLSVQVDDTGGQFTLAYGRDLRGRPARAKMFGPDSLPTETHFTWFTGVIDGVSKSGQVVSIDLRMKDDQLAAPIPRSSIRQNVFTSIPGDTDLLGKAAPYIVGDHDSTGINARGMVRCHYVGSPASGKFQYLLASGWWLTVVRVFSDGVEMATPADYTVVRTLAGDVSKVTLVEFSADQESKEILVDVQDLESDAGPATTWRQLLADLSYSTYRGTHADPALAPVDAPSVAALDAFISGLGLGRSYALPADRRSGVEVTRDFLLSYDAHAYWGYDGNLRVIPWDIRPQGASVYLGPGAPDAGLAQLQVLGADSYLSDATFTVDAESSISSASGKSGVRASDGAFLNQRSVVVSADGPRSREAELSWLPASAESVGNVEYMIATGSSGVSDFAAVGAASIHEAVSQGPPPAALVPTVYAQSSTAFTIGQDNEATFDIALSDVPEIVASQSLVLWLVASGVNADSPDTDQLKAALVLGGTPYPGTPVVGVSGAQRFVMAVFPVSPATSLPFTRAELNGASMRVAWAVNGATDPTKRVRVHQAYAALSYTAAANVSPATLSIMSRLANRYRVPPTRMRVEAPLSFLDYDLGDDIPLEDAREGWGRKPWERGRGRVVGMSVGPGASVGLELEDVLPQLTSFWLRGEALAGIDGASAVGDGVALIVPGSTVSVSRASVDYVDSPAGIDVQDAGPVVRIFANCWPSERRGTLVQRERVNELDRSSFKSGLTGLTVTQGSGSVVIDQTVGEQLFNDAIVTDGHALMTAGAPHSAFASIQWPTTGNVGLGSDHAVISVDYRCSSALPGDGPTWRLARSSDGWFFNDTTGAWQSGAVGNALTPSLTWVRSKSKPVPVIAGGTREYTMVVRLSAGGTALRTVRLAHSQLESSLDADHGSATWRSSRIVTDASGQIVREATTITLANDGSGAYVVPNSRGTMRWRVVTQWSSVDATTGDVFTLMSLRYDADNAWLLRYVVGTGMVFTARSGGTDVQAIVDVPLVADTEYYVAARWTSSLGEWDKPLMITLVLARTSDRVELGRSEAAYTPPVFAAGALFGVGCDTSLEGKQWDGYIVEARVSPAPDSDEGLSYA
jgi:hypothetical protein